MDDERLAVWSKEPTIDLRIQCNNLMITYNYSEMAPSINIYIYICINSDKHGSAVKYIAKREDESFESVNSPELLLTGLMANTRETMAYEILSLSNLKF